MPGEKSGYSPGDKKADEYNEDGRELTPEEQERERALAQKRIDILVQKFGPKKIEEEAVGSEEDNDNEDVSSPDALKLGDIKENRSKIKLGISSARRAKDAKKYNNSNRSEGGQETGHNREIKDILKKFIFAGTFKLRTAQEKGKYILRVLSGPEGDKDSRSILKVEDTLENIKTKLEKHFDHNFTKK